jgi:hypothetical protein
MHLKHSIQEHIDPATGRRLVSVSYPEGDAIHTAVIPFEVLADGLLGFLAQAATVYDSEVDQTEGFRKFEALILQRSADSRV